MSESVYKIIDLVGSSPGNSGNTLHISHLGSRFLRFEFSIQQLFQFFYECNISHGSIGSLMFSEQRYFRILGIYG